MAADDLLERREQAAVCLARGMSTDATGEAVGASGRTVRRWREEPDFKEQVAANRQAMRAEAAAALGSAAREAVDVLCACLQDDSAHVRVRAALGILSALPSIVEHVEFEERLTAIEQALTERGGR